MFFFINAKTLFIFTYNSKIMTLNKIRMLIVITAKKDFPSEQNSLIAMTMLPTGTNRRKK